jgi:HD superfamily phosphohydrolase
LFDVAVRAAVVEKIDGAKQRTKEKECFDNLLEKYFKLLDKFKDAEKIKRNAHIKSLFECRNTILDVYKVIKMLFDVILIEDMGRKEPFDLNLNTEMSDLEKKSKKFLEIIDQNKDIYNQILNPDNSSIENRIASFTLIRGDKLDELKKKTLEIKEKYNGAYHSIISSSDDSKKEKLCSLIKERFNKITHIYQLNYPINVICPISMKEQFMCEEGKIYSLKEALLRTFELRRARWLYMSGALHAVHRAATHTRLSHEIGSMIVAVNALKEIDMYPLGNISMPLGEYLLMRGELCEFLMANFLHDIGHPPLSHVLEPNPFIELDHEKITRNLILGERTEGEEEMDWYVTECYLLKMKAIKDFKHRFFENSYDPIYDVGEKEEWTDDKTREDNFLSYLDKNNEILESESVTVKEVLDNFGIDKKRVIEILSGKVFCPNCETLSKINGDKVECKNCGVVEIERERIYDTQFLNKLIDSEIDFDRIDHVKRDSTVCGLSLISFRLLELLGSMSVVLPWSHAHNEIHERGKNKPYIIISEEGVPYLMDLLTARRCVFRDILYSDENNWINGVVNQITALAVRYLPHLTNMLPFITDQILAHFYTIDLFLGTEIEKLNKLFHGKMNYSAYGTLKRYKLKDGMIVTKENLEGIYPVFENINKGYEGMELPAVVFYTNIKPTKCPNCRKEGTLEKSTKMLCPSCKKELNAKLKCKNENCDRFEKTIKSEDAIKVLKCKECNTFSIIIDPSEDLEALLECPFYNSNEEFCGGIMKKQKRNLIECKKCRRKICKLIDERWDDMLVFGKKFVTENKEKKYYPFEDLVGKYKDTSRERFPERPSELDVKNLFYVWVSDFCDNDEKEKIIKEIEEIKIGETEVGVMTVDLDKVNAISQSSGAG